MTHLHYRVWDGEQMHYWDDEGISLTIEGSNWFLHHERIGYIASSEEVGAALMWGTGVKDKNSRPIYEQDITKFPNGDFNKVILNRGRFLMKINGVFGKELDSTCEVISNIYQNPNLLLEAAE
ncbi:YopX family protein [Bacillus haynesii]|uniref:YopX family protein n=1 Tax=Bacillus haynesii TaxID=1925021 RepID=UPI0003ED9E13|nr:YopX family protein [Bacillus haynesii]EWH20242.1 hypothetical protein M769_0122040 [Bacillus haynesii]